MVLFGLSQIVNAQNFLKGFDYETTEKYLNAMEVVKTTPPLYSVTVKYGERNPYFEWEDISLNREGCSFSIKVDVYCDFNVLTIVDCSDCQQTCWNGTLYQNAILVLNPGLYTATVFGPNCQSSSSMNIAKVGNKPEFSVESTKACSGEKGTLRVASFSEPLVSFAWSNGATTSSIQVPKGMYSVTATNAQGCANVAQGEVKEFLPSPAPMVTPSINADGSVTLTSSMPSGNMWSNGATSQSIKPEVSGVYTLKVKDSNGCYSASSCPSAVSVIKKTEIVEVHDTVIVNSPLSCPLTASFMHEVNLKKVNFKNTSSGEPVGYLWMFGDGTTSTEVNPMHDYAQDGTYEVKLFTFKGVDQSMIMGKVFINTKTGNGGGGNATCPAMASFMYEVDGMEVDFRNTSSGDGLLSYLWDFGDGTSSTEKNPVHKYSQYKSYKVTLYVNTPNGLISASQNVWIIDQNVLNGTVCDSLLIKASNGMKNGEAILPYQITSQTKLVLEHPNANNWSWSPTGQATDWSLVKTGVGRHHFYVSYFVNNKKQCSVFDYEILGGGITGTNEEAENRSSNSDKDINVYPNPTSGPVELDLSGLPGGQYLINVISQSGQTVTKKVIKQ